MIRFGFGLENLGHACLAAPRVALVAILLVIVAAGASATRLTFDHALLNLYRTDSTHFGAYLELIDRFPVVEEQIVLLFEGDGIRTAEGLSALRSAALDAQFVDGVLGVMSIFGVRERPVGTVPPATVIPVEIPEGDELDAVIDRISSHPLASGKLIAEDGRATLMLVSLDEDSDTIAAALEVRDTVSQVLQDEAAGADISLVASGSPLLRQEIIDAVRRDQLVLNAVGTTVSIVLCLIYFGRWRYTVITMAPGIAGVILTLGGFSAAGQSINALTNVLPTLVLVLAFADSLHMVHAVRQALGRGESAPEAARWAVISIGPACAMTSLTTALVFLALATSPSGTISDMGFAGAWASAMAFLAVMTIVPTLSALMLRGDPGIAKDGAGDNAFQRIGLAVTRRVTGLVDGRTTVVALAGIVVLGVFTAGYFSAETRYGYRDFLPDRSSANIAIDRIDSGFGGTDSVQVLIVRPGGPPDPGNLGGTDVVRAVHMVVDEQAELSYPVSLKSLEDWLGEDVSDWRKRQEGGFIQIPGHLAQRLEAEDGTAWLVTAYMPAIDAQESLPVLDRLDAALDPVREAAPDYTITVTGLVPMTARASEDLISSLNESLVAAIAVTILLIAFTLRSVFLGLLAAAPNLLPLAAAGTYLYFTGEGLQITSVVALTIAFGIAVDDTIHLVNQWQREALRVDPRTAVRRALGHVGPVLVATTTVLIAGTGATLASEMGVVRLFGTLCMITFAAALIADLFLMPALMMVFSRALPRRHE